MTGRRINPTGPAQQLMAGREKAFRGWLPEALEFYEGLEADNSKTYRVGSAAQRC
jgi:hypothetical protein